MTTSRTRGPWTPSTRWSSMPLVADDLVGADHAEVALRPAWPPRPSCRCRTRDRRADVRARLGQAEHRGVGARGGQARHETQRLSCPAGSDGNAGSGVPPVDLAELARAIRRALLCPRREERRADPGEVVLEDRQTAPVPVGPQALADDGGRCARVGVEDGRDPARERSSSDPARARTYRDGSARASSWSTVLRLIPRRRRSPPSPAAPDGRADGPRPSPPPDALLPPRAVSTVEGASQSSGQGCSEFDRRNVLSFGPASTHREVTSPTAAAAASPHRCGCASPGYRGMRSTLQQVGRHFAALPLESRKLPVA